MLAWHGIVSPVGRGLVVNYTAPHRDLIPLTEG
jgi:hypothetical protein